jgi:tetraacyldisaccharide 4'-kinase
MQHLAVARHGDLVLLRPEDLGEEWGRVIPAGSWREGPLALGAATAFAMKVEAEELSRLTPAITDRLAGFGVPFFSFSLVPQLLRPLFQKGTEHGISIAPEVSSADGAAGPGTSIAPGTLLASETFRGSGYLLLSGVGGPDRVAASATAAMGKKPLFQMVFADHHPYTAQDVREAARMADRYAPDLPILCTGKDAVKLLAFEEYFQTHPVLVLEVRVAFGPALFTTEDFPQWWGRWWRENGSQPEKA